MAIALRVEVDNPAPEDLETLREMFRRNPDIALQMGDVGRRSEETLLRASSESNISRQATAVSAELMRESLGYATASGLERVLIQDVVLCWMEEALLRQEYCAMFLAPGVTYQLTAADNFERRLLAAQRRHLRAVEMLAKVRALGILVPGSSSPKTVDAPGPRRLLDAS